MVEQVDEEGQVGRIDALLVQGQDIAVAASVGTGGLDQIIAVLDPLGNALGGDELAAIIAFEEDRQLFGRAAV
jgi:hypothetical protein